MKKFCIITNKSKDECFEVTKRIETLISEYGGTSVSFGDPLNGEFNSSPENIKTFGPQHEEALNSCECVIVLGGDGTILETSRAIGEREIPMVGINLGTLGFMSCIERSQIDYAIKELVEDNFTIENRMQLKVTSSSGGKKSTCLALNDVTVTRSGLSRLIKTDVIVNGQAVGSYSGDGCLVSTPTGSTGYNLSAGGPIIEPTVECIQMTPLCPHSLMNRPMIFGGNDRITASYTPYEGSRVNISTDGGESCELPHDREITIFKCDRHLNIVQIGGRSFYRTVSEKLMTTLK